MGFEAKILFVFKSSRVSDQVGPGGETECVVWEDSDTGINFGHITRLEKILGERFRQFTQTSFRRAGICVLDCFFKHLSAQDSKERCAPEILIDNMLYYTVLRQQREDAPTPTITLGGESYLDCSLERLMGRTGNGELVPEHNLALASIRAGHDVAWPVIGPPLFWASCVDLTSWLSQSEEDETEGWKAILEDRNSLAIVRGWRHMLREMGEVGARAVFRFS